MPKRRKRIPPVNVTVERSETARRIDREAYLVLQISMKKHIVRPRRPELYNTYGL